MMKIYYALNYDGSREESHRLLEKALERYESECGCLPEGSEYKPAEKIQRTEKGKPFIPGGPHFSISHTGQYWAVLMDDRACGLDIQKWQPSNFLKLAFRFYNKDEYLAVKEKGEAEFFRIWARREALRKAEGESVFSEAPSVLWNRVVSEEQFWEIRDITMPFDIAAAVCIGVREENIPEEIEMERL